MTADLLVLAPGLLAVAVWVAILARAERDRVDITALGLVLVMLGLASTVLLAAFDIATPGVWGFIIAGVLMLLLWSRHVPARRG